MEDSWDSRLEVLEKHDFVSPTTLELGGGDPLITAPALVVYGGQVYKVEAHCSDFNQSPSLSRGEGLGLGATAPLRALHPPIPVGCLATEPKTNLTQVDPLPRTLFLPWTLAECQRRSPRNV